MNETYLMHNGKRIELTDEQKKLLGVEDKSPFERVDYGETYLYIKDGKVIERIQTHFSHDDDALNAANYCTDRELMEQRALHETLNRMLWRFSCENGELENPWDGKHGHYNLCHNKICGFTYCSAWCDKTEGTVYYPSCEIAKRAIDEIVKPFMEAHPDFVW